MERRRKSSQLSKSKDALKTLSFDRQFHLDQLIHQDILRPMRDYDPKLDFTCVPIVSNDQAIEQLCRHTCGLIWNPIRSPTISRLVRHGRSCALVEILQVPSNWSRYDADLLLTQIHRQQFLNGLSLRDEVVRVLRATLAPGHMSTNSTTVYEFQTMDYTRDTITLTFQGHDESAPSPYTLIVSLILLLEFDVRCLDFFPKALASPPCAHDDVQQYFFDAQSDACRTRLTPHNSIRFRFDGSLIEARLCAFVLQRAEPLSLALKTILQLRNEWLKYVSRAANDTAETTRASMQTDRSRLSTTSMNTIATDQHKPSLQADIKRACESLFSTALLRQLFLAVCLRNPPSSGDALQMLDDALENGALEHPLFNDRNLLFDDLRAYAPDTRLGVKSVVKLMLDDWPRNRT